MRGMYGVRGVLEGIPSWLAQPYVVRVVCVALLVDLTFVAFRVRCVLFQRDRVFLHDHVLFWNTGIVWIISPIVMHVQTRALHSRLMPWEITCAAIVPEGG
jgi:hypothetical protein